MSECKQPIGIFDSGLGGISVLKEIMKHMPNEHYIFYGDSANAPYGTKPKEMIIERCIRICDYFVSRNVKAILIACNTATSVAAPLLREKYNIPIIGMEPALKVAAHNKQNQQIIVMATPLTLKEKKFEDLMSHYSNDNHIIKMPCPELVEIIEQDELENETKVMAQLSTYFQAIDLQKIDSIVLGCTHFVFYRSYFKHYFNHINTIDGNLGTSNQLQHILEENNMRNKEEDGSIEILNSSNDPKFISLSKKLLEKEN